MNFGRVESLWLLAILAPLSAWVARGGWRRRRDWAALGMEGRPRSDGSLIWLAAMVGLIVALSEPRWGREREVRRTSGPDVVLVVDVSRSMGVEDAVPDRLGVAIEAAESLVSALGRESGGRAAVVAFAGRGVLRCPLTENLGAVGMSLRALRPGGVRPGGTDIAEALGTAVEAFDDQNEEDRSVVLFSDGEDLTGGDLERAIKRLREAKVVVHSVAIGDPDQGHPVPSGRGTGTLSHRGAPVLSRRSDRSFETLSGATGGTLVRLGLKSADLGHLYITRMAPIARRNREVMGLSGRKERFPLFVLAAIVLGVAGSFRGVGRGLFPIGMVVASMAAMPGAGPLVGRGGSRVAELVASGRSAYDSRRFSEALAAFERAVAINPAGAIPRYDAAAALFQLHRFPEALTRYRQARERADAGLRTKIDFAMGNTMLAIGEVSGAIRHYDDCLASTVRGPVFDAIRRDAAMNRRFAQEQATTPSTPPIEQRRGTGEANPPASRKPSGEDEAPDDQSGPKKATSQGGGREEDPPSSRRRGAGGAGGNAPSAHRPGSPDAQLDAALENIRDARRRRLPEESTSADEVEFKDW